MATIVYERPAEINWSKNLIRYVLQTDTPFDTPGLAIEVQVLFKRYDDDLFREIYAQPCYPDKDGVVTFYLAHYLSAHLDNQLQDLDTVAPQIIRTQTGKFYIHFREVTKAAPDPEWNTEEAATPLMVIKGGLSYARWQGPNWFINYFATQRPFLTWQLSGKSCAINERMYLYFLMPRPANGQVTMDVKAVFTDGTENNAVHAALPGVPAKYDIYALCTGATELALPALEPAKKLWYYEVSVTDAGGMLAAPFRYNIDWRNTYNTTRFNYVNSLGGIDSCRVLGAIEANSKRNFETASITPATGYVDDNSLAPQEFMHTLSVTQEWKGNLGYLQRKEMQYLHELFYSKEVLELRFNRWWRVLITSEDVPQPPRQEELPSLPVAWKYGFTDTQFTPDYAPVGNLPTCPVVTNAAVTLMTIGFDKIEWTGDPLHRQYVVEWFLNQPGIGNPQTSGITYSSTTTVTVPHSNNGGTATIKAICDLGNRSQGVTIPIGGPV